MIRVQCPNPACGQTFNAPAGYAGRTVRCIVCGQPFRVGPLPPEPAVPPPPQPAPPPAPQPPPPAQPTECPVCKRRLVRRMPKCLYCGAAVTVSADEQKTAGVDLAGGLSIRLLSGAGRELLTGTLAARDDGLHLAGYPPGSGGASAGGELAGRVAASAALTALLLPTIGVFAIPRLGDLGQGEEPQMTQIVVPWANVHSVERLPDRVRLTVSTEKRGFWGSTTTKTEVFDIALASTPGGADRCYGLLCEQILKYMQNPSAMPHCPGCGRVVKSDARRCAYCGAKW